MKKLERRPRLRMVKISRRKYKLMTRLQCWKSLSRSGNALLAASFVLDCPQRSFLPYWGLYAAIIVDQRLSGGPYMANAL